MSIIDEGGRNNTGEIWEVGKRGTGKGFGDRTKGVVYRELRSLTLPAR